LTWRTAALNSPSADSLIRCTENASATPSTTASSAAAWRSGSCLASGHDTVRSSAGRGEARVGDGVTAPIVACGERPSGGHGVVALVLPVDVALQALVPLGEPGHRRAGPPP